MTTRLNPYLSFAGDASAALAFYQDVFGGDLTINHFGDFGTDDHGMGDKVMHGQLETASGLTLMAADMLPGDLVDALVRPATGHGRNARGDFRQPHDMPSGKRGVEGRRSHRFDTDDPGLRIGRLDDLRHAGDKTATADGDDVEVSVGNLLEHLDGDRALSRDDGFVGKWMHVEGAALGGMGRGCLVRLVPDRTRIANIGAQFAKLLAGATMFAAMFVVNVAMRMATSAAAPISGLPDSRVSRSSRSTGFQIASP